jgi:hypothetical protein
MDTTSHHHPAPAQNRLHYRSFEIARAGMMEDTGESDSPDYFDSPAVPEPRIYEQFEAMV